ncbi:MAG: Hsp70 family protein, partial [Planctomycetes bacterium]|nr:Hsp70 family protein [Planctomycetota bacterium]
VLGHPVAKAVITVPAFFNELQREATRQAGELAGLEIVRIINEPTAASLAYDPLPSGRERLLVYDLGGGTFDVSIVQIEQGVVEVLASHGDTHLGGDDFDQLLLDHICDRFREQHGVDLRASLVSKSRMLRAAEEAKKQLSFDPVVTIEEEFIAEAKGLPLNLSMELRRHEYEALIEPLLLKTLSSVDQALDAAQLQARQIDKVVLVGGANPGVGPVARLSVQLFLRPDHPPQQSTACQPLGNLHHSGRWPDIRRDHGVSGRAGGRPAEPDCRRICARRPRRGGRRKSGPCPL